NKSIKVNVDHVRIYHPRERDEGVVETDGLNSEGSTEYSNKRKGEYQSGRRLPVRMNGRKRPGIRKMTSRETADESGVWSEGSSPGPPRGATDSHRQVLPGRSSPYQLRSRRHIKEGQEESRRSSPYPLRNRLSISERQATAERKSTYLTKARRVETASSSRRFRPYK
ncbi:hypothetical protein NPIL_599041, partial [Nephila pilipes]